MVTEAPNDAEIAIVKQHFGYIQSLVEKGTVLLFGRTRNSGVATFGIVILRAGSWEEAQSIMSNDPAVKQGVMHAELYEYEVGGLNTRDWQAE